RIAFYDLIFPILVVSYLFYADNGGGNRYGPLYYFDDYPFLVVIVVSAVAGRIRDQRRVLFLVGVLGALTVSVLVGIGAYAAVAYQFHRIVNQRMELFDLVADANLSNAIVIIGSLTGSAYPMWMSSGDLTRNGIDLSGSVLYANDIRDKTCALARAFPGRALY